MGKDSVFQAPPSSGLTVTGLGFLLQRPLYLFAGVFLVAYALFQKKLLPLPLSKIVSQIMFYPTFPITAIMRIGNYWTKVDETLYLGCAPLDILNHPAMMHKMGVRGVVNMCYEYSGPKKSYERLGMKQLHLPVVDHTEVPLEDIKEAVAFIKACRDRGEKVLVHCKAGHGRGASIALAWMMHEHHADLQVEVTSQIPFPYLEFLVLLNLHHLNLCRSLIKYSPGDARCAARCSSRAISVPTRPF